jgi:hypothetical protein
MSDWRDGAAAIRTAIEKRKADDAAASARRKEPEGLQIVTGEAEKAEAHEYEKRTLGLTCDLDSLRYWINLYLLRDSTVRIAVSLMPSHGDGCYRDYGMYVPNEEIERWFGGSLVRLYDYR